MKDSTSAIKARIRKYMEFHGLTEYELNKKTGISKGTITTDSGITEKNLLRFLDFDKDVSLDWLVRGAGNMYSKKGAQLSSLIIDVDKQIASLNTVDEQLRTLITTSETQLALIRKAREYLESLK